MRQQDKTPRLDEILVNYEKASAIENEKFKENVPKINNNIILDNSFNEGLFNFKELINDVKKNPQIIETEDYKESECDSDSEYEKKLYNANKKNKRKRKKKTLRRILNVNNQNENNYIKDELNTYKTKKREDFRKRFMKMEEKKQKIINKTNDIIEREKLKEELVYKLISYENKQNTYYYSHHIEEIYSEDDFDSDLDFIPRKKQKK
jgi:hypothetical protein